MPPAKNEEVVDDLRADIEAAFKDSEEPREEEQKEAGGPEEDTTESLGAAGEEETIDDDDDEEIVDDADDEEPEADVQGSAEDAPAADDAEPDDGEPAVPADRAPVSWKAKAREAWAKVPPEARLEIQRREQEVTQALQTSTKARQFQDTFAKVVQPYMPYIQAEGVDPLRATQSLLDVAATLHAAPPRVKAQTIAQLVTRYKVDIKELDDVLSAQVGPQGQQVQQAIQQAVAPYQQMLQRQQQERQQQDAQVQTEVLTELQQFAADPKNEFFNDVRGDMADLLEAAGQRGQRMTIQQAYQKALKLNPEVSEILTARQKAVEARERAKAAKDKRRASSSLRGSSSGTRRRPVVEHAGSDLRADLENAMSMVEERSL